MAEEKQMRLAMKKLFYKLPFVFISLSLVAIIALFIWVCQGKITLDGFAVGLGTFLLSMATFYLAYLERSEGRSNRMKDIILAERDNRRLRLKEQLEGLYSPLVGLGGMNFILSTFDFIRSNRFRNYDKEEVPHGVREVNVLMSEIKSTYKFLATDDLIKVLDSYYEEDPKIGRLNQSEWNELMQTLWSTVQKDYDCLSKEYSHLTKARAGD